MTPKSTVISNSEKDKIKELGSFIFMDLWVKSATLLPINILRIKNLTIIIY